MFTTAAQLLDLTDSKYGVAPGLRTEQGADVNGLEKLLLVLRDGRKLIGVLRSWDQFGMCFCTDRDQGLALTSGNMNSESSPARHH